MAVKKKTVIDSTISDLPKTFAGHPFYGVQLDEEQVALADAIASPDIDIVFVDSKAGTGKTFVTTGVANILVKTGRFESIVYIMSPYGEQKQGYMPGTITEKSAVYFEAFYQAMDTCGMNIFTDINDETMVNQKNGTGFITCITDTFLRGSNLNNCVVILDECQNFTVDQLKKVLTRVGKNTKVVCIGHHLQCDLEHPEATGFVRYIEHFKDKERAAFCTLTTNHRSWISQWADEL